MKKILACTDNYVQNSNWTFIAMLKACVLSIGVFWGLQIPKKHKKKASIIATIIFVITYVPIMITFFNSAIKFYKKEK